MELNYGIYKVVPISFRRIRNLTSGFFYVYAVFLSSKYPLGRFLSYERAHTSKEGEGRERSGPSCTWWSIRRVLGFQELEEAQWDVALKLQWPSWQLDRALAISWAPKGEAEAASTLGDMGGQGEIWIVEWRRSRPLGTLKSPCLSWEGCIEGRVELGLQGLEGLRKEALGTIVGSSYPDISASYSCLPAEIVHSFFPPRTAIISSLSPVLWFSFRI